MLQIARCSFIGVIFSCLMPLGYYWLPDTSRTEEAKMVQHSIQDAITCIVIQWSDCHTAFLFNQFNQYFTHMKLKLLLPAFLLTICTSYAQDIGSNGVQSLPAYSCNNLTVDSVLSYALDPTQIQLNVFNHDTGQTWGPTYFCITSLTGDTIATYVTCGCVLVLRNSPGILRFAARNSSFRVPNNFTCNVTLIGDNVTCQKTYTGGILTDVNNPVMSASMNLYPNPAHEQVTIDWALSETGNCSLTVSDLQGRQVMTQTVSSDKTSLSVYSLKSGIYLVQFFNQGILQGTHKLILN